jgi:hypothetical protein
MFLARILNMRPVSGRSYFTGYLDISLGSSTA